MLVPTTPDSLFPRWNFLLQLFKLHDTTFGESERWLMAISRSVPLPIAGFYL